MAGIRRFEDIVAWQKARSLTKSIYTASQNGRFAKDFGLRDQIQRAAVSIMSNIAEGFERSRNREFHQYLSMAKASCAEVRSLLYVSVDTGYLSDDQFAMVLSAAEETARIIGGLRASLGKRTLEVD
jgi:four helix bundle protein